MTERSAEDRRRTEQTLIPGQIVPEHLDEVDQARARERVRPRTAAQAADLSRRREYDEQQRLGREVIPNPGDAGEPMPEKQAYHPEQTDPPPGPYPDPPLGPYPDPVAKDPQEPELPPVQKEVHYDPATSQPPAAPTGTATARESESAARRADHPA